MPHHIPLLAAAMLVEARFPKLAIAGGTIDRSEARRARTWAEAAIGEMLPLPVCVNARRLGQRLAGTLPLAELDRALDLLLLDDRAPRRLEAQLAARSEAEREPWLKPLLAEENRPSWADLRAVVVAWLNVTRDLPRLCELANDAGQSDALIDALASAWIAVSHEETEACRAKVGVGKPHGESGEALTLAREEATYDLDHRLDTAQLHTIFERAFGPRASELHARLREQTEREVRKLGEPRAMLRRLARLADAQPDEQLERLFLVPSVAELSDAQRRRLTAFADTIRPLYPAGCAAANAVELRRAIAEQLRNGPALSETALATIQCEDDTEVLCFLLAALAIKMPTMTQWYLQRAVLENRTLARFAGGRATG